MRGDSKALWALIIVFVNILGPLLYFFVGRDESRGVEPQMPLPQPRGANAELLQAWPALPTSAAPAIETTALTKSFGRTLALDRLALTVPSGSIFGFLGPNGAGKTTTLRLLTGLARPTAGHRHASPALPIDSTDGRLGQNIGYLDQDPRFYGWMTGRELLELVGRLYGLRGYELEPARRRGPRDRRARHGRGSPDRRLLGRDAPAPRHRPGADEPAAGPVPRRAGQLARSGGPARPARGHRRAARVARPCSCPPTS